jgi:hypothetical protein
MVVFDFSVARLRVQPGQDGKAARIPEVYLRFRAGGAKDLSVQDKDLCNFCFPLGPEAVQPKEFMASEVSLVAESR